jgi:hypothetical protein
MFSKSTVDSILSDVTAGIAKLREVAQRESEAAEVKLSQAEVLINEADRQKVEAFRAAGIAANIEKLLTVDGTTEA